MSIHDTIDLDDHSSRDDGIAGDALASGAARDERELALLRLFLACSDALDDSGIDAAAHGRTPDR